MFQKYQPRLEDPALETTVTSDEEYSAIKKLIKSPHGLIFVTDPDENRGKIFIRSMLNKISDLSGREIAFIEEEQVDDSGIEKALKWDPDVIYVSGITKDNKCSLIKSALTGDLVIGSWWEEKYPQALVKYLCEDLAIEPFLIASTLQGVITHNLAKESEKVFSQILTVNDYIRELIIERRYDDMNVQRYFLE